MPLLRCQQDRTQGWKWGVNGTCFTGEDARERAVAVGRAIHAQKQQADALRRKGEDPGVLLDQSEIETAALALDSDQLIEVLGRLDPLPDEPADTLRGVAIATKSEAIATGAPNVEGYPRWVKKLDPELRIVWAEVYSPDVPDTDGEFMSRDEIRKMAHRFLAEGRTKQVDVGHDNRTHRGHAIVESFIAREDDSVFVPGSWVAGVHVPDEETWSAIRKGEINGFSMQAWVQAENREVEIEVPEQLEIEVHTGGIDGHRHRAVLRFDPSGVLVGGETLKDETGHFHRITRGTITELANEHTHRYSFVDRLPGLR